MQTQRGGWIPALKEPPDLILCAAGMTETVNHRRLNYPPRHGNNERRHPFSWRNSTRARTPYDSIPFQSPFFPDVPKPDDQDGDEDPHFDEA